MGEPVIKPKIPAPDNIPISAIEAKQVELLGIKQQLEFQLNGVVNQLHLIDQLLHPAPPPAPDNTI